MNDLLFRDGADDAALHSHWRKAITADPFRYRAGATRAQRWETAYERLRLLNEELPVEPAELAADARQLAALHEWAAVVDGATATVAGIHYNLFLGTLVEDRVSPARDLSEFATMRRIGTFLCTERAHGNDAAALETIAEYDALRAEFVLHTPHDRAAKYMPNTSAAGGPKTAVVAARLLVHGRDEGAFLFVTPLDAPGVTVEPLPDRIGSPVDHCVTTFDRVRLPRTALVQGSHVRLLPDGTVESAVGSPRRRFLHAIGRVTPGKLCMSASVLGGSRAALAVAVRYAHVRKVTGPAGTPVPLSAYRSHHGRLLECVADAYAMTFLHRAVTERWMTHPDSERADAERLAAVAKGWITWRARDIIIESRERCGARALFPDNGIAEYLGNVEGAITAEGDNLAVWAKAGAEMIFACDPPAGSTPATGAEDLTDPDFLRGALSTAERHWHLAARRDLRSGNRSADAFARWNNASSSALGLVEAHAVGRAADAFLAAAGAQLPDLAALFLLRRVREQSGLLLAQGALTTDHVRELPRAVEELIALLAPELPALTEAFGVPEEHLGSLPMLRGL